MQQEFMTGHLDEFVSYMSPDIIDMMGGVDKVKEMIASGMTEMAKTIEKTSMGKVSDVVVDGGRMVALVPVETLYKYPDGKMIQKSYRIACSTNDGASWTFIDGQGRKDQEEYFRKKFPILTEHVQFPKCGNVRIE
jgi:hypothetical protein